MPNIARWTIAGAASLLGAPLMAAEPMSSEEASALREEVRSLRARLAAIEAKLGGDTPVATPAAAAKPSSPVVIGWKGSPQFTSDDRAFKMKGRIQADASYISSPRGIADRGFGFSNEMRRIRLGGEGKLGSGFGYKLELELSDNKVDLVDTFVTFEKNDWQIAIGNQNQFQALDELIGDTGGSMMERAAFTDAFNFERRLGIAVRYHHKDLLLQAGVFTDDVTAIANDSDGPAGGDENDSFSVDGRIVYAPKLGPTQLHFGASGHLRELNRLSASPVRYRQRPYLHSSNSRVLATPNLTVERELNYGAELAGSRGPWHMAAEAHWLKSAGPGVDPRFFGSYVELGYVLTGETRGYRDGIFTTVSPKRPFGKGGPGAVQINLRYDYLDLNDAGIVGGKQNAWLAAIIWTPIDHLRFNLNYGYLSYSDAAIRAGIRRDYGVHVSGVRLELDF